MVVRRQRDHRVLPMEGTGSVPVIEGAVNAALKDRVRAPRKEEPAIPVQRRLPEVTLRRPEILLNLTAMAGRAVAAKVPDEVPVPSSRARVAGRARPTPVVAKRMGRRAGVGPVGRPRVWAARPEEETSAEEADAPPVRAPPPIKEAAETPGVPPRAPAQAAAVQVQPVGERSGNGREPACGPT